MNDDTIDAAMEIAAVFEGLKVPYMIGGSVASTIWGEPRFTRDVDFVADLREQHVVPLGQALGDAWYADEQSIREAVQLRDSFNVIRLERMVKVDVFVPKDEGLDASKWARLRYEILDPASNRPVAVTSPEDIVLQKLDWFRKGGGASEQQWRDVAALLRIQEGGLDHAYLKEWAERMGMEDLLERAIREARPC